MTAFIGLGRLRTRFFVPFNPKNPMSTLLNRLILAAIVLVGPSMIPLALGQSASTPLSTSLSTPLQGRVVDPQGRSLAGATLLWEGTARGTSTNNQGEFVLERPLGAQKLLVRYVGYQPLRMEIPLGAGSVFGQDTLRNWVLQLQPSILMREEVVVTAGHVLPGTPVTSTRMDADELRKQNNGQDMPYVLQFQPSTLASSDAGAGIGYPTATWNVPVAT
ncbi:MAG: carboxypeptidase-like regulatory domain-containing protein [Cytophagia bacterium]|nr:carboxypeptidase-like regulatory domain-containing protein [Cytophagia bacterium]